MQNREILGKNFTNIGNAYINDKKLAKLEFYITSVNYLQKTLSCFIKVSPKNNNKTEIDTKKLEFVSNFKEEKKKSTERVERCPSY